MLGICYSSGSWLERSILIREPKKSATDFSIILIDIKSPIAAIECECLREICNVLHEESLQTDGGRSKSICDESHLRNSSCRHEKNNSSVEHIPHAL